MRIDVVGLSLKDVIAIAVNSYEENAIDKQEAINSILGFVESNYIQTSYLGRLTPDTLNRMNRDINMAFVCSDGDLKSICVDL